MNVMLTPLEEHLTIALWEEHQSVEDYWEGLQFPEYHVQVVARNLEYLGYEYTRRYMKAIITECQAIYNQSHYMLDMIDMVMIDMVMVNTKITRMNLLITDLSMIKKSDNGALLKLLHIKQKFVLHYNHCLDYLDNLSLHVDQKTQLAGNQGTFLHSRVYLGTGDNTILVLQQQMFPTEEKLSNGILPL